MHWWLVEQRKCETSMKLSFSAAMDCSLKSLLKVEVTIYLFAFLLVFIEEVVRFESRGKSSVTFQVIVNLLLRLVLNNSRLLYCYY